MLRAQYADCCVIAASSQAKDGEGAAQNGAPATVEAKPDLPDSKDLRQRDFVAWMTPRIPGQPWTAPAYDHLAPPPQAPRLFCALSSAGVDANGEHKDDSCTCLTEQGTRYAVERNRCEMIVKNGQYEPFRDEVEGDRSRMDDATQRRRLSEQQERDQEAAMASAPVTVGLGADQVTGYGDMAGGVQ